MKKIIVLLFTCISCILFSQSSFSENLMQKVTSENLSEGTANVRIPIKDVSIDGYKLNLGLSYNTKGVLVNADAGVVGLNWNLAGLGLIVREVRDGADEVKTTGHYSISTHCPPDGDGNYICYEKCYDVNIKDNQGLFYNLSALKSNTQNAVNNIHTFPLERWYPSGTISIGYPAPYDDSMLDIDTEPDIFKVSLPNGEYFEFYFDLDKKVKIKSGDYSNYIISYSQTGNQFNGFTIKNADGITFYFTNYEATTDGTSNQNYVSIQKNTPFKFAPDRLSPCEPLSITQQNLLNEQASTAWYVSKIVNQFGEEINFNYGIYNVLGWSRTKSGQYLTKYSMPLLNLIYTNSTAILFKKQKLRQDVLNNGYVSNLPEIESIEIYDVNKLKNTDISWTIPVSFAVNDLSNLNLLGTVKLNYFYSQSPGANPNYDDAIYKRMYLDNVLFRNKENKNEKYYRFKYYGDVNKIPVKISGGHDAYGYTKLTSSSGSSSDPIFDDVIIGNLKTIETNDALQSFYYESNYYQKVNQGPIPGTIGAGVRIQKIATKTRDQEYIKEFKYGNNGIGHAYFNTNTESNARKIDPLASDVYYEFVTEITKSKNNVVKDSVVYKYNVFKDIPANGPVPLGNTIYKSDLLTGYKLTRTGSSGNNSGNTFFYNKQTGSYPYLNSRDNFNLVNGKLLYVGNFSSTGQKVSESFFDYDINVSEDKFLFAKTGEGGVYTIRRINMPLKKQTDVILYNGKEVKRTTNLLYNNKNLLNKKTENDGINNYETNYQYAHELTDFIGSALLGNNDINALAQTTKKKDGLIISSEKNVYEMLGSKRLECYRDFFGMPSGCADVLTYPIIKTHSLTGIDGTNFPVVTDKVTKLNYYNTVAETQDQNGQYTSYINGYNNAYAIAVVKGARYDDIKDNPNVAPAITASNNGDESTLITKLNSLSSDSQLSDYQITTYTYKPSVGISTITPPSGIRENYHYDSSNRLEKVTDINGNILKEYKYNYIPIVFSSAEKSRTFTRMNCGPGTTAGTATYTVTAGKYTSLISQEDADQQAENDLTLNGQSYADINGVCTPYVCTITPTYLADIYYSSFQEISTNHIKAYLSLPLTNTSGGPAPNWSNGVFIGTLGSLCRPSSYKSISATSGGSSWNISIAPTGIVTLTSTGGTSPGPISLTFEYDKN
ncbi:DUF5977 domain-containing protein [Chryseobacterium oranimense]|uniref:DUF5977 domain-containing protein n=1 Tax=Chryseobacterium oranimense TaxID=421058 RepID=UPI002236B5A2|nr:DUF5977 domain-containing protein [Chryseobacterium oranimense]